MTYGYDGRGNLTSDGLTTFVYDAANRLTSATTGGVTTTLTYDALDRLFQVTKGSATTRFLYDGDRIVAEYNGSNVLQRRYAPGPEPDETMVWYEGSGTADRRWLTTDRMGSTQAVTNASGVVLGINTYDEAGIPGSGNIGRFQWDGQPWISEIGLYHLRARTYSPTMGRFMQTDPILYEGGMNWYAYAGDDPVNGSDPTGMLYQTIPGTSGMTLEDQRAAGDAVVRWATKNPEQVQTIGNLVSVLGLFTAQPEVILGGRIISSVGTAARLSEGTSVPTTVPVSTLRPGPYADRSIPARSSDRDFTAAERAANNENMAHGGCHTCGTRDAGTISGNAILDHQPPSAVNPPGGRQELYPQCLNCSARQMREVRKEQLRRRREGQ